jgi:hypothetical protein
MALLESNRSAITGGQTAGQEAIAFCPICFPAQPEAWKSEKLIALPYPSSGTMSSSPGFKIKRAPPVL